MRFPFKIPAQREFDCVGFGLNAVDHLITVPAYPEFDTKVRLDAHTRSAGGQTASAMVALQRLGPRTTYAGRFGSDDEGAFGLASLRSEGVNVEFAEVVEGARTQIAFIVIDARTGERTIIWDRDERLAYTARDAPVSLAARGRVLHLDAHDPPACTALALAARESGTIVSADIDNIYDGLAELLPLIDVLISSKDFPRRLTGLTDERAALAEMKARLHPRAIAGMTMGARGAVLYHEGEFVETPAFPVPGGCRDTTGAGDAFHAGFIYGMLVGESVEACLTMGCAVAALKCRSLGARAALPSLHEMNQLITGEGETS